MTVVPAQTLTDRGHSPRSTPAPPAPFDPATPAHCRPDRWPLRSFLELAALDSAPGSARAHASALLWEWNLSIISDECTLVVSEMLTNAVESTQAHHRPEPIRLWMLGRPGSSVLILIWDPTRPAPMRRAVTPDAEQGRGLNIVDALSVRWGFYHPPGPVGGKVVWALMSPENLAPGTLAP